MGLDRHVYMYYRLTLSWSLSVMLRRWWTEIQAGLLNTWSCVLTKQTACWEEVRFFPLIPDLQIREWTDVTAVIFWSMLFHENMLWNVHQKIFRPISHPNHNAKWGKNRLTRSNFCCGSQNILLWSFKPFMPNVQLKDMSMQCSPRSGVTERGVWSGSICTICIKLVYISRKL